jgi:hypothetical protein
MLRPVVMQLRFVASESAFDYFRQSARGIVHEGQQRARLAAGLITGFPTGLILVCPER